MKKKYPQGIFNPLWWCMDGWNYYGMDRKNVVEKLKKYMTISLSFDGMLANYPNGGVVCVIWNYNKINPIL